MVNNFELSQKIQKIVNDLAFTTNPHHSNSLVTQLHSTLCQTTPDRWLQLFILTLRFKPIGKIISPIILHQLGHEFPEELWKSLLRRADLTELVEKYIDRASYEVQQFYKSIKLLVEIEQQ